MPKSPRKKKRNPVKKLRKVLYPKYETREHTGKKALTAEDAKFLLGWEEETEERSFGGQYIREIYTSLKRKVRCYNNISNRPIQVPILRTLKQEILRKKWRFNGEPVIIGKTGLVLNGQHSLMSLVLAVEEWKTLVEWQDYWKSEPTMEKDVKLGIDESDEVVNTMDTCKPRSLADVIYRSTYFAAMDEKSRKTVSNICGHAIRMLWHRTGASLDAFAPLRTHAESLDFLDRHPKLLECISLVHNESNKKVRQFLREGYTTSLIYLMGCSNTNPAKYKEEPSEKYLDWSLWDKACDFWVELWNQAEGLRNVGKALSKLIETGCDGLDDRMALLVKAWNQYADGKPVTIKTLQLEYIDIPAEDYGVKLPPKLNECPVAGGIDIGDPKSADENGIKVPDPTPDEIRERAAKERKGKSKSKTRSDTKNRKIDPSKKPPASKYTTYPAGTLFWVNPTDDTEPWQGRLVTIDQYNTAKLKVRNGFPGAGTAREVPVSQCTIAKPGTKDGT